MTPERADFGDPVEKLALTHVTHRAMATEFVVVLPPHAPRHAVDTALEVLERLDGIEAALTVHSPTSEISQINRFAGKKPIRVCPATLAVIQRALEWSVRTGGAMDITAGPLVDVWGFTTRSGRKPSDSEIAQAREPVGYQNVEIDQDDSTVFLPREGMKLNLGSIGKGDALDRLAGAMRDRQVTDFLIHGGHSSVIASGNESPSDDSGWCVGLSHPTKPTRTLGTLWIKDHALGTSGSGKQFFHHRGQRFSHVIDPRTGYPGSDLMSISVLMRSAADADAAATGLFVEGTAGVQTVVQAAPDWLPPMVAVSPGHRQEDVETHIYGDVGFVPEASR